MAPRPVTVLRSIAEPVFGVVMDAKVRMFVPAVAFIARFNWTLFTVSAPVVSLVPATGSPMKLSVPPLEVNAPASRRRFTPGTVLSTVRVPGAFVAMLPAQLPRAPPRVVVLRFAVSAPVAVLVAVRSSDPVPL